MAVNTVKNEHSAPTAASPKTGGGSIFKMIEEKLSFSFIFEEGLPIRYAKQVIFVVFFLIVYIANSHLSEKMIRRTDKMKSEVEDLRTDYTTLKAEYMFQSKQSEVAKKVAVMGIVETKEPPYILIVKDKDLK